MKINELIQEFEIWTTNEEQEILKRLKNPVKLSSLTEHDQFKVQAMIRKSLVSKYGHKDPTVVANEKNQKI
jgi:NAD dependent epimerase/dehydratase family enzyme